MNKRFQVTTPQRLAEAPTPEYVESLEKRIEQLEQALVLLCKTVYGKPDASQVNQFEQYKENLEHLLDVVKKITKETSDE